MISAFDLEQKHALRKRTRQANNLESDKEGGTRCLALVSIVYRLVSKLARFAPNGPQPHNLLF